MLFRPTLLLHGRVISMGFVLVLPGDLFYFWFGFQKDVNIGGLSCGTVLSLR